MMNEDYDRNTVIASLRNTLKLWEQEEQLIDGLLRELEEKSDAEEFRTPKKVLIDNAEYSDGRKLVTYGCPTCKIFIPHKDRKYCSNCGQALDWSEVENE